MEEVFYGFEYDGYSLRQYADLLKFFGKLGFKLSPTEKMELQVAIDSPWHRTFYLKTEGLVNGSKYSAAFKLARYKYDNYFTVREYDFTLHMDNEKVSRTFYIDYKDCWHADNVVDPITKYEAYNLLCGRAVFLEDMGKWIQLDFTQSDEAGNFRLRYDSEDDRFRLEEAISRLPIKGLDDVESKARLLESLRSGSLQSVIYTVNGVEERKYIEVSPHFRILNIYDENMRRELHISRAAQDHLREDIQKNLRNNEHGLPKKGRQNGKQSI